MRVQPTGRKIREGGNKKNKNKDNNQSTQYRYVIARASPRPVALSDPPAIIARCFAVFLAAPTKSALTVPMKFLKKSPYSPSAAEKKFNKKSKPKQKAKKGRKRSGDEDDDEIEESEQQEEEEAGAEPDDDDATGDEEASAAVDDHDGEDEWQD